MDVCPGPVTEQAHSEVIQELVEVGYPAMKPSRTRITEPAGIPIQQRVVTAKAESLPKEGVAVAAEGDSIAQEEARGQTCDTQASKVQGWELQCSKERASATIQGAAGHIFGVRHEGTRPEPVSIEALDDAPDGLHDQSLIKSSYCEDSPPVHTPNRGIACMPSSPVPGILFSPVEVDLALC